MSTKIYNAYRISHVVVPQFFELVGQFYRDNYEKYQKEICWRLVERHNITTEKELRKYIKEVYPKERGTYLCDVDFRTDVSYRLYGSRVKYLYVWFSGEPSVYKEFITLCEKELNTPNFERSFIDYHFQNQTDPPSDITNYAWQKREKIWDELIPSGVFSRHMPSIDLVPDYLSDPGVAYKFYYWADYFELALKNMGKIPEGKTYSFYSGIKDSTLGE